MKMDEEGPKYRSIEVKGMNGLSIQYIKRYFSYAGQVEDVKKLDESVIVKFKHFSHVCSAHKFNGRVVDKSPIKIRNVSYVTEDYFDKKPQKKQPSSRTHRFKNTALDLSKHWSQIMNTLKQIKNSKQKWLISQLFSLKLQQIMHNHIYHSNIKASFNQLKIKELILNIQNCPQPYTSSKNQNVEVLELKIDQPDKLQCNYHLKADEGSYYSWINDVDVRIRSKLKSISKHEKKMQQLRYLYHLLENNMFIIEEDASIIPSPTQSTHTKNQQETNKKYIKASIENQGQFMFQVKFTEEIKSKNSQRCEFRSVDEDHHSKQIEVISDSQFHQNPTTTQCFTFFYNPFDGCIGNVGSKHIFHEFLPYKSANHLLIRHYNMNRNKYTRLQYALRLLNCQGQVLKEDTYYQIYSYTKERNASKITQLKLAKHTLIIEDLLNKEKVLYMVKQYIHYMLTKAEDYFMENENQQFSQKEFIVILVSQSQNQLNYYENIINTINEGIMHLKKPKFYLISINDSAEVKKKKCLHYLEEYIDKLDGEMNEDLLKLRVQQLLTQKPHEIVQISNLDNYREFILESLWKVYLEKGKRKASRNIKSSTFAARK